MNDLKKILLILDLDETLVYSNESKLSYPEDFNVGEYFVYKRPGLTTFLDFVFVHFDVAIWTSSTEDYAEEIVKNIIPKNCSLNFIYGRTKCTSTYLFDRYEYVYIKNLAKLKRLNYSLERILIIDDSPEKIRKNYGNHICVAPFTGSNEDQELFLLVKYLDKIKTIKDVRKIEKRWWRLEVK